LTIVAWKTAVSARRAAFCNSGLLRALDVMM
jgi:hypothetical protein